MYTQVLNLRREGGNQNKLHFLSKRSNMLTNKRYNVMNNNVFDSKRANCRSKNCCFHSHELSKQIWHKEYTYVSLHVGYLKRFQAWNRGLLSVIVPSEAIESDNCLVYQAHSCLFYIHCITRKVPNSAALSSGAFTFEVGKRGDSDACSI